MSEFEKLLYSPELKMVLFFLLQKSLKRVQCSNEFKGRHGSSVYFVLPITLPQLLWNLKKAKKLHVNGKIRDPRQTNMSPEHYFKSCKQLGLTLKNC